MEILWDLPDDPKGNVRHIAEHDLAPDEVEEVLRSRRNQSTVRPNQRKYAYVWLSW